MSPEQPAQSPPTAAVLDPADPAFAADPFPRYAALRAAGPVTEVPLANGSRAWLVTGYEQARRVLADPRFSNVPPRAAGRPRPDSAAERARAVLDRHMLNTDAPTHTRLRRTVVATFTPRRVDALRPRVERVTADLLDRLAAEADRVPGGVVDLVGGFAFPLPVLVICEVLGVPAADRDQLREWTYTVGSPRDAVPPGAIEAAWSGLHRYFGELIAAKRRRPGEDLFSSLVHATDGGGLDDDELLAMAFLLLFAGYETTMNLVATGALLLLTHPGRLAEVTAAEAREPGPAPGETPGWAAVVEETLRHGSPLEGTTWRRAAEEVELDGVIVPAGASVLVVLAAANRDPAFFPDPDRFDPDRYAPDAPRVPNLAFGHGPHFCLGSRLARMEGRVALATLFARHPRLELATDPAELPWRPGLLVRGPRELPVRLG